MEVSLSDQRRDDRTADHDGDQDGVLALIDQPIGQAEEGRDGTEGQAGGHQQGGVRPFAGREPVQSGQGPDPDHLGGDLGAEESQDQERSTRHGRERHEEARLDEVEGGEHGEGDRPHPLHQHPVANEHAGDHQADQVGGQHRLALRHLGEAPEQKEHQEQELHLRLADPVPGAADHQPGQSGQVPEGRGRDRDEQDQPHVEVGEQDAEGQDGAEVGDEAGGEDQLAEFGPIQAGFDHHGIDHRHRRGGERDPRDVGRIPAPVSHAEGEGRGANEGDQKADGSDREGRFQVAAEGVGVDLGPRQKGQEAGPEGREEVDPPAGLKVQEVAGGDPNQDLDQGNRDSHADRDQARQQGQRHPGAGNQPDIGLHVRAPQAEGTEPGGAGRPGAIRHPGDDRRADSAGQVARVRSRGCRGSTKKLPRASPHVGVISCVRRSGSGRTPSPVGPVVECYDGAAPASMDGAGRDPGASGPRASRLGVGESGRPDLNRGPPAPEAGALTGLRYAP